MLKYKMQNIEGQKDRDKVTEIYDCHGAPVFLFPAVYNSFILFFELKEFREDQFRINFT